MPLCANVLLGFDHLVHLTRIASTQAMGLTSCTARGLIGPMRQVSVGRYYNPILYWMLGGAFLPLCTWLLARRYPNSWFKYINVPVGLAGLTLMPPATGINWSSWFMVGFVFRTFAAATPASASAN